MPEIVDTNFFDAGCFAATLHFMIYIGFGIWEHALVRGVIHQTGGIILYNAAQESRQGNIPLAFWRFRLLYDFLSVYHSKGFCDMQNLGIEIKIRQAERQKLPFPDAGIKQQVKNAVRGWLVYGLDKCFVLLLRPKKHSIRMTFAHATSDGDRIAGQIIIFNCIIEDGRKLVIDGF